MLDRQDGLTKTYNRVHDPDEHADDIARLRELHVELDYAVRDAYGWTDLDLGHGFHETRFGTRFTFAPAPRQEVLDRLLELNHERYAEEVRQGLHGKPKAKGKRKAAHGRRDDHGARRCLRSGSRRSARELRDELEELIRDDLIGPIGGPEEELERRTRRPLPAGAARAAVHVPARRRPRSRGHRSTDDDEDPIAADVLPEDELADGGVTADEGEEGTAEERPPAVDQLVPSSFGMTFALDWRLPRAATQRLVGRVLEADERGADRPRAAARRGCGDGESAAGSVTVALSGSGSLGAVCARPGRAGGGDPRSGPPAWRLSCLVSLFLVNEQLSDGGRSVPRWLCQASLSVGASAGAAGVRSAVDAAGRDGAGGRSRGARGA